MKLKRIIFIFFITLILSGPACLEGFATVYYVAKTGSSDGYPGTLAQPWLTINKAAATMVAGDTVYVRSGNYNEQVEPVNSGTAGNPITYAAYPGEWPCIDAAGLTAAGATGAININGKDHLIIDGFEIKNAQTAQFRDGIYSTGSHITFRNLTIHDTRASAIESEGGSYVTIDSCTIYNACLGVINEVITLKSTTDFEVKNCTFSFVYSDVIDCKEGGGNGLIHDNEICGSTYTAAGIYIDANGTAIDIVKIYNNRIHGCDAGIALGSEAAPYPAVTNVDVYNNIVYDCGFGFAVWHDPFSRNFRVVNNVFYHSTNAEVGMYGTGALAGTNVNCVVRNNIMVAKNDDDCLVYQADASIALPAVEYNIYYDTTGTYYHEPAAALGNNYIQADPRFVDPVTDFDLRSNSPAIDAGSPTGAPAVDYNGTSRPQGSGCDIGAFEYRSSSVAFRFAAWADSRDGYDVLETISDAIKALSPAAKFTVFSGDLCATFSIANITTLWKPALGDLLDRTFVTRGNHDKGSITDWQSLFSSSSTASSAGVDNYTAETEDATYSFDYGNSHFVVIDLPSGGSNTMESGQIAWLDNDLTNAEDRLGLSLKHIFLFWHGPVYTVTTNHASEMPSSELINVINAHPLIKAGFFGHEHVMIYAHVSSNNVSGITNGLEEFTMGRAGAPCHVVSKPVDFSMNADGFAAVDVSGNDYTVSIYKADGTVTFSKTFSSSSSGIVLPSVTTVAPQGNDAPADSVITVSFSKAMDHASAVAAFSISPAVAGSFSWQGETLRFQPSAALPYNTTFNVKVSTAAKDGSGGALSTAAVWQFTTVPAAAPQITSDREKVYPNPYRGKNGAGSKVTIANLPGQSTVRIYNITGDLIATLPHRQSAAGGSEEWDVSSVASGIYFYVVSGDGIASRKGKIGIVK